MYLATAQPARRARRRTLGDFTNPFTWGSPSDYGSNAWYWAKIRNALAYTPIGFAAGMTDENAIPTASAPSDSGSSQFIPGSSASDYLWNAVTGHPTDAQIAYNTNSCVQAIQNMPGLTPEAKAMAQARCTSDQQAYTKLIGGTAQQVLSPANLLSGVLPESGISTWAWLILGGVVGVIVLTRR